MLNDYETLKWLKIDIKPRITQLHKIVGKEVLIKWMKNASEWNNVLFSDEELFNLDGPF